MPTLDYLLGEIAVDNPHGDRDRALEANPGMVWPEGHWAVSDEQLGYLGFLAHEEDAWAFRLYVINLRQNGAVAAKRYAKADKAIDADDLRREQNREEEWVVVSEASNGNFYMRADCTPSRSVDDAHGYPTKARATANGREWAKKQPRVVRVRRRKDCR